MAILSSADFFSTVTFLKSSFRLSEIALVSINLDPDQARSFVKLDLGPNCSQRLSADDKSLLAGRIKLLCFVFFFSQPIEP